MLLEQLSTLSHPHRMAVFRMLLRRFPDFVPAGEISASLQLKPSTASVYLSALSGCGLIEKTRSGTSLRYRLNLDAAKGMVGDLFLDCCRGRPDLCPPELTMGQAPHDTASRPYNVLFVCTGNSARSIFAEALLRQEGGDRFRSYSAGTHPFSDLNPIAIELLKTNGIDVAPLRAKTLSEFQAEDAPVMDFVFTVCDRAANEDAPALSGHPIAAHWGLPDPVQAIGTDTEKRSVFQQTLTAMGTRIRAFADLPFEALDRASLQARVDDIARIPAT